MTEKKEKKVAIQNRTEAHSYNDITNCELTHQNAVKLASRQTECC